MSKGRDALSLLGWTLKHHQPWLHVTFVTIPFQITLSTWLIYVELWFSPHLDISELRKFDEKDPFLERFFLNILCLNGNWILWGWLLLVSGRWTRLSTNRHRLPPLLPWVLVPSGLSAQLSCTQTLHNLCLWCGHCAYDLNFYCFFAQMLLCTFELGAWDKEKYSLLLKLALPGLCFGTIVQ